VSASDAESVGGAPVGGAPVGTVEAGPEPGPTGGHSVAGAVKDVVVQIVGRFGNLFLGLVVAVLLARTLGVEGNGRYLTIIAIVQTFGTIGELGLEPTVVRTVAAEPKKEPQLMGALLSLRLLLSVPAALLSVGVIALVAGDHTMLMAGILIAASSVATAPTSLRAVFQLRMRNHVPLLVMTLNSVLWTAAVVGIGIAGGGLVAVAAALLVVTACTSLVQAVWARRETPIDLSGLRDHGRALVRVGVQLGIASALTMAYVRVDQVLVLHYAGAREAGLYGVCAQLVEKAQFVPAALLTTMFPLAAAAWPADPERLRRIVQRTGEYLLMVGLPVFAFALVASRPLLRGVFGEEFTGGAPALPVLMASFVLVSLGYLVGYLAIVLDLQKRLVLFAAIALAFNVAANLVLLPRYGFEGAAWVTLATEVVVLAPGARMVLREIGLQPDLRRPLRMLLAATASCLALLALRAVGAPLLALVAAMGAVYPALLFLLHAVDRDELRGVLSGSVPDPSA
jgi:O-antigen/teichoic acid export membrane protein